MIKILIPSCGESEFFKDSYYPKNLYEIDGQPMIQKVIHTFENVDKKKFIFLLLQNECNSFHTDNVVELLAGDDPVIIRLKSGTGGALCSCLMAIESIDNEDELIISNNDQIIDENINNIIAYFRNLDADGGVVCFDTIHPRWSYVRVIDEKVVEAAEKRPISHNAIAGLYYFKNGSSFVNAAKEAIRKGSIYEGRYYITAAINEMILEGRQIRVYNIDNSQYHSFYTPERIRQYQKGGA